MSLIKDIRIFLKGYSVYKKEKQTPEAAYLSMRRLFAKTNGRFNNIAASLETAFLPKYKFGASIDGILGTLSLDEVKQVSQSIRENGFYVFPRPLEKEKVDELIRFARTTPAVPRIAGDRTPAVYSSEQPVSPVYDFTAQSLFEAPVIQSLLTDPTALAIAQEYLGPRPMLDLVTMWWSTAARRNTDLSGAAQLYHFDMDRIKFLKFFIYLSDVDTHNGPHCYVKRSHRIKPKSVRRDGRIPDEELMANYPAADFAEITGKAGTILAVDTSGFHKGKPLEQGERLLFQMEFATSMFGQNYPPVQVTDKIAKEFLDNTKKYERTYKEILREN